MIHIYKASAGSGKTYRLTLKYLELLLGEKAEDGRYSLRTTGSKHHRHILAITFTNKATEEMKRRIIHELAVLGGMEPGWKEASPYLTDLTTKLRCTPEQLRAAARKALPELLFDFSFFHVSTIDAFFQTILRTFAREVQLTGNYDLELDIDYAIHYSLGRLLSSISLLDATNARKSDLMRWIVDYMEALAKDGKSFNIFNRSSQLFSGMVGLIKDMLDEKFSINAEELTRYLDDPKRLGAFITELTKREKELKATAAAGARAFFDAVAQAGYDASLLCNANAFKALRKWAAKGWSLNSSGDPGATIASLVDNPSKAFTAAGLRKCKVSQADVAPLEPYASAAAEAIMECFRSVTTIHITRGNLYMLGLLGDVLRYLKEYCTDNNLFLLSDTNDLLRKIIGDDDVPFIYERMGIWLDHFLIDEFQDTSRMQWLNLRPLLAESNSNSNDNLIIGDEKQCIYRFRNSDPTLLQHTVAGDFHNFCSISGDDPADNTNWRSSADVIQFNNTLFTNLAANLGVTDIYGNVSQQVSPKHTDHHGYVQVTPLTDDFTERSLDIMATEIKRQIAAGYRPGEIAVLTRKGFEAARVIEYLLGRIATDPEFPQMGVISDDSLRISKSPSVRFIVSVLRYAAASDASTGRTVSARRIASILNRYEYLRTRSGDEPAAELLEKAITEGMQGATTAAVTDIDFSGSPGLASVTEHIIRDYISPEALRSEAMYITAFQDLVTDFCERGEGDIQSFLQWWDASGHRSTVSSPEDINSIRVMTIHKSKGLEFRCVHLPFVTWKVLDDRDVTWFIPAGFEWIADRSIVPPMLPLKRSKNMAHTPYADQYKDLVNEQIIDELNIAYVAFTRAIDELIVQCSTDAGTMGGYIYAALGSPAEPFIKGEPTTAIEIAKKELTALDPRIHLDMPAYSIAHRTDVWGKLAIDDDSRRTRARERGIAIHAMMSGIRTAADVPRAVRRAVANGTIEASEADEIERHLLHIIDTPLTKRWFSGYKRLLIERPIFIGHEHRRPDRVVWTADGTVDVIDYKTGETDDPEYTTQLLGYIDLLRRSGATNVRGYLWFLDTDTITPIS